MSNTIGESDLTVSAGGAAQVVSVAIGFDDSAFTNNLVAPTNLITTNCDCNPISSTLQLINNLGAGGVFQTFLFRNLLVSPRNIPIYYDDNSQSWHASQYWSGLSASTDQPETWNFVFEWACTTQLGPVDLGNSVWKFGMTSSRIQASGSTQSRILMTFASNGPCIKGLIDFTFSIDVNTKIVTTDPNHFANDVVFSDGIGQFVGPYFQNNPIVTFSITTQDTVPTFTRLDTGLAYPPSAIFPEV